MKRPLDGNLLRAFFARDAYQLSAAVDVVPSGFFDQRKVCCARASILPDLYNVSHGHDRKRTASTHSVQAWFFVLHPYRHWRTSSLPNSSARAASSDHKPRPSSMSPGFCSAYRAERLGVACSDVSPSAQSANSASRASARRNTQQSLCTGRTDTWSKDVVLNLNWIGSVQYSPVRAPCASNCEGGRALSVGHASSWRAHAETTKRHRRRRRGTPRPWAFVRSGPERCARSFPRQCHNRPSKRLPPCARFNHLLRGPL